MNKLLALCSALVATAIFAWGADALPNYEKTCASCHGKDGKGATKAGRKAGVKDLTDKAYQTTFTDAEAFTAIKDGMKDESGKEQMKPFGDKLTDEEIKELVAYIRTLGN